LWLVSAHHCRKWPCISYSGSLFALAEHSGQPQVVNDKNFHFYKDII
jgi:hypothetical protein